MNAAQKQTAVSIKQLQTAMMHQSFAKLKVQEQELVKETVRDLIRKQLSSRSDRVF